MEKEFKNESESNTFRQKLKEKGIKFQPLDNYGVAIDIESLSDKDMRFIRNLLFYLNFFKIDVYADSCGGFGCNSVYYSKIVAAKNKDEAIMLIDLEENEKIKNVEEFGLPPLKNKRKGFIVC